MLFTKNKYVLPIGLGTIAAIVVGAIAANTYKPETASAPKATPATPTPIPTVTVTATAPATPTPTPNREAEKAQGFVKAIAKSFEPRVFKVGDEIDFGGRRIRVTDFAEMNDIVSDNAFIDSVRGRIIYVSFVATNTSDATGNMLFSNFTLKDSQGRSYSELDAMGYKAWRRSNGVQNRGNDLYPGERRVDVAAFRVAPDATGFTMVWNGNAIALEKEASPPAVQTPSASTSSDTKPHAFAMTIKGRDYATHVNLRSEPNTQSSVVAEAHTGDGAEYINESTNNTGEHWYKVRVNGNVGWIYEDLVSRDSRD